MDHRSPPRRDALSRFLGRWDGRAIGHRGSRRQGAKLAASAAEGNWSLRRLVVSTVSVNAVLWVLTAIVLWWAY
ncbi:MAG TPA: hypothetical protein VGA50_17105 [Kiloniellales bacterium]